jgi:ribosomal protein S18 acetylase RimI-like enzyme
MSLSIRRGRPDDTPAVTEMNARMALETERKSLDLATLTRGVRAVLSDENHGIYFVAELEGAVAAQLMITREWSDWRDGWIWWIQSVYVRPEARRQGIFRALYDHVLGEAARAQDVVGLRLYVERDNETAQRVYLSLGMQWTTYHVLERCPL